MLPRSAAPLRRELRSNDGRKHRCRLPSTFPIAYARQERRNVSRQAGGRPPRLLETRRSAEKRKRIFDSTDARWRARWGLRAPGEDSRRPALGTCTRDQSRRPPWQPSSSALAPVGLAQSFGPRTLQTDCNPAPVAQTRAIYRLWASERARPRGRAVGTASSSEAWLPLPRRR